MADGNLTATTKATAKRGVGRPRKARGAANSSDAADARWTIRGVPLNVRNIAIKASENRDMTVGDWLAEAVVAYARGAKSGISADNGSNLPALPVGDELVKVLTDIQDRLGKIESAQAKPLLNRIFGGRR